MDGITTVRIKPSIGFDRETTKKWEEKLRLQRTWFSFFRSCCCCDESAIYIPKPISSNQVAAIQDSSETVHFISESVSRKGGFSPNSVRIPTSIEDSQQK